MTDARPEALVRCPACAGEGVQKDAVDGEPRVDFCSLCDRMGWIPESLERRWLAERAERKLAPPENDDDA